MLLTREVAKRSTQGFTKVLLRRGVLSVPKDEMVDTEGKLVPINKLYVVEVPTRLVSYASMSLTTIVLVPMAWQTLDIL